MKAEPKRDWLREREVLDWQPWMSRFLLRKLISGGHLRLKVGGTPEDCDVWQRGPRTAPRFYRTAKIRELCSGTNGVP